MNKKEYTISVFTEDQVGLLNRVTIIFTRRKINIKSLAASESEIKGIHRYTIVVEETKDQVQKIVGQLEKQVEVLKAVFHDESNIVYQEIALYKLPTDALVLGGKAEGIVRVHNARILSVEKHFTVVEKTGHKEETTALFKALEPVGLLEFVRSGRIAITKPMKTLQAYLEEMEEEAVY
ncbi:MAG: acetolactate synthase small subunit [Flavobacteriales bacterium]|nr:acetolactate synthase small subunit [Flavobacteriales bacterium]